MQIIFIVLKPQGVTTWLVPWAIFNNSTAESAFLPQREKGKKSWLPQLAAERTWTVLTQPSPHVLSPRATPAGFTYAEDLRLARHCISRLQDRIKRLHGKTGGGRGGICPSQRNIFRPQSSRMQLP